MQRHGVHEMRQRWRGDVRPLELRHVAVLAMDGHLDEIAQSRENETPYVCKAGFYVMA